MKVDLGRQLRLPSNITVTNLRPDIIIVSEKDIDLGGYSGRERKDLVRRLGMWQRRPVGQYGDGVV